MLARSILKESRSLRSKLGRNTSWLGAGGNDESLSLLSMKVNRYRLLSGGDSGGGGGSSQQKGIPFVDFPGNCRDKKNDNQTATQLPRVFTTLDYRRYDNDEDQEKSSLDQASSHYRTPAQQSAFSKAQEFRIRAALAVAHELAKGIDATMASNGNMRHFSTSNNKTENKAGNSNDDRSGNQAASRTEPDFAEYLSGEIEKMEGLKKTENQSATKQQQQQLVEPQIKLPEAEPLPDFEASEQYRFVRRKQKKNVEQARQKTAANVRRALYGNLLICGAKFGAWVSSGSSAMLSEFIHSVVDSGNQALLLLGLRDSGNEADRRHNYGYGKSVYFWALVSALGTFFLGAGVSGTHAVGEILNPSLHEVTWEVWTVLGLSLVIDGYVFARTIQEVRESMPRGKSLLQHLFALRDPATLAVLLEDGAACLGVVIAVAGISACHSTGNPVFDGAAGLAVSALLGSMGLALVRVNHRFLLGQAVDADITKGIEKILLSQRSIDNVYSVQSQWTGPDTFSYKAEVDFDGTYLAALLMPRYQSEFLEVKGELQKELRVLLSWYAEDVMRTVEREVRHIETEIRKKYPGAEFIELEPMSKDADRFAIDDGMEAQLRRIELDSLNRYLKTMYLQPDKKKDE